MLLVLLKLLPGGLNGEDPGGNKVRHPGGQVVRHSHRSRLRTGYYGGDILIPVEASSNPIDMVDHDGNLFLLLFLLVSYLGCKMLVILTGSKDLVIILLLILLAAKVGGQETSKGWGQD